MYFSALNPPFMKPLLLLLCLVSLHGVITHAAEPAIPTGYRQVVKLSATSKQEDVYQLAEEWFKTAPGKFTQKNAEPPVEEGGKKAKNKAVLDNEFNNSHPLQVLDPSVYKVSGLGMVKYYGGTTTSIRLLYIKYDITILAEARQTVFEVSNVRYFHFDAKNFQEAGIFAFEGGKPCDHSGTMQYLNDCQQAKEEYTKVAQFFNQQLTGLFTDFKNTLQAKKLLYVAPVTKNTTKKNRH